MQGASQFWDRGTFLSVPKWDRGTFLGVPEWDRGTFLGVPKWDREGTSLVSHQSGTERNVPGVPKWDREERPWCPKVGQKGTSLVSHKIKEFYEPEGNRTLSFAETFWMATKQGGSLFGNVGSLEPGYAFDALVISGMADSFH